MSRALSVGGLGGGGFPRVSGDEPTGVTGAKRLRPFSPRERG